LHNFPDAESFQGSGSVGLRYRGILRTSSFSHGLVPQRGKLLGMDFVPACDDQGLMSAQCRASQSAVVRKPGGTNSAGRTQISLDEWEYADGLMWRCLFEK
jgi:hypothetical protein